MIKFIFLLILLVNSRCNGFELITTFYPEKNVTRIAEYYYCLNQNLQHPLITNIHIFYENQPNQLDPIFNHPKIKIVKIAHRPSFSEIIDFANHTLFGKKIILANTDIFFDDSLFKLNHYSLTNKFMCLTRYNLPSYTGNWERHVESHDSWIFESPTKLVIPKEIKVGYPACDLIIQRIACITQGLEVSNPSLDIYSLHYHNDDQRQYDQSYRAECDKYPRIKLPFSHLTNFNLSWGLVKNSNHIRLYAGTMPKNHRDYGKFACISNQKNNSTHLLYDIRHPIPLPNNSVDVYQAENIFAYVGYYSLPNMIDEIYRVLKPGGLCRISLPDYRCDILANRYLRNKKIVGRQTSSNEPAWLPKIENVKWLLNQTLFAKKGKIEYLHYYTTKGESITNEIDYSLCYVKNTPDHDERVQNPYRALSIVVDLYK
jgi:predicted SAM-dependent methyltransferase